MHGVQIGSHKDLPGFLEKLVENGHLAMDFWAFIGKLSHREGGELSDDQTLAVVIEGITDSDVWQEDGGLKRTVERLRAMLAGVDVLGTEERQVDIAFPRTETGSQRDDRPSRTHAGESPTRPSDSQASLSRDMVDEDQDPSAVLSTTHAPRLEEELLRLELTRLLKQYFDDVAKRISKREPHLEAATSMGTIASAMTRRSLEEPPSDEMEEERLKRISRLVADSPPSFVDTSSATEAPLTHRVARRQEPQLEGYGKSVSVLLLVAWLIGAAFAVNPYRKPLRRGFSAWVHQQLQSNGPAALANLNSQSDSSDEDAADEQTIQTLPSQSRPAQAQPSQSQPSQGRFSSRQPGASSQPPIKNTLTPPPIGAPPTHSGSATTSATPRTSRNSVDSGITHKPILDRPLVQSDDALADNTSGGDSVRIVQVDPSTMEGNLIVSRVPVYPEAAKANRVAGHVTMQAIIAKDGTVKRLHVTEGDSRLRTAAVEAVYKWRYKPYMIDGEPVEATTTITVNFNPVQ